MSAKPPENAPPARETLAQSRAAPKVAREKRAGGELDAISGRAACFYDAADPGTEYRLWSDTVERVRKGAFDRAVAEDDCRCLFNHDDALVLGRTKSKTCRLSVDSLGLNYECDLPDTEAGRSVRAGIDRGDIDGSSFTFIPLKITWEEQRTADGKLLYVRWLDEVQLFDVGPVTYPAYAATSARADSPADARVLAERAAWLASRSAPAPAAGGPHADADLARVALALLEVAEADERDRKAR